MEKVDTKVWDAKDRALDAQSAIKSATSLFTGTGKTKKTLGLAVKFYNFIQSKRKNQVNNFDLPKEE